MYTHSWGSETLPFQNSYQESNSGFPTCGMSKNHLGEEERKKETTAGGMCVRVRVSNSGICFSKTRVDTVMGAVLLAGAGPSSSRHGKAATQHSLRIYSQKTINQHQAINLAFEPSLKPIKAHSCQMEFILISFQSQ